MSKIDLVNLLIILLIANYLMIVFATTAVEGCRMVCRKLEMHANVACVSKY